MFCQLIKTDVADSYSSGHMTSDQSDVLKTMLVYNKTVFVAARSHLEPKVMLNVQLESDWSKIM